MRWPRAGQNWRGDRATLAGQPPVTKTGRLIDKMIHSRSSATSRCRSHSDSAESRSWWSFEATGLAAKAYGGGSCKKWVTFR